MLCENFLEQNLHLLLVFYTLLKWVISAETAESKLGLQYEKELISPISLHAKKHLNFIGVALLKN